jgi:hypothetical protein
VYSLSGIYLFDSTTVGDPASATSFIVTDDGLVGINTDTPTERLTIIGNISAQGSLSATNSLYVANNSYLGNAKGDFTTVRGTLRVGDNNGIEFGNNNTAYNVNLYYGGSNILRTDDLFVCNSLSAVSAISTDGYFLSGNALNLTGFDSEIHVSQLDGNDTTGNGDLLRPVKTIAHALTLVSGTRRTVIVHPGSYNESPSITVQSTVLNSYSPLGGTTFIQGTLATSVGCTIAGFQIGNLDITAGVGVGDTHIIDCTVTGTLNKSGNAAFTEIHHSDINVACNVTGAGLVAIDGCNANFLTVDDAAANVIVRSAASCVAPVLISGTMSLVNSVVIAAASQWDATKAYAVGNLVYNAGATYARIVAGTTATAPASDVVNWAVQAAFGASDSRIAVATYPGSVVTIANCQIVVPTYDNVARVSLNGVYSIFNVVYDKPNSTLTGTSTNSIDYFQHINADKVITPNGNSDNWNSAYEYATTYPIVTSINYSPYNLIGATNTNIPLFTVPAGRKFICTSFGGNIIEVASTAPAGTCTVRLINSTRGNSATISTNFTPSVANIAVIDNTNIYGNVNSVAVSGGETVSLRLANAPTGFTVLSAVMFATGVLL